MVPFTPISITLLLQLLLCLHCLLTLFSLLFTLIANLLLMLSERCARQWLDEGQGGDEFTNTHPVFTAAPVMSFANATRT